MGEQGAGVKRAVKSLLDAGVKNIEVKLYPSARHELLVELNREEVFADIGDWLERGCKTRTRKTEPPPGNFGRRFFYDQKEKGGEFCQSMGTGGLLAADGCEASLQIGDDVIDVLGADGQADGVLIDLLLGQLLIVQLAVGGGGRVDDQALHVCNVCQQEKIFRLSMNLKASSRRP